MKTASYNDEIQGFTLLEVLIASAIFFAAMFTVLELTSRNLNAARNLQPTHADISALAGSLFLTNRITDDDMVFVDGDFGDVFPNHTWGREIVEAGTNGLFQANYVIYNQGKIESRTSVYIYRPQSRITRRIGGPL